MKRFSLLLTALLVLVLNCLSQPVALDPSFGIAGKVYTNLIDTNRADERTRGIAMQADGKIVIVGSTKRPAAILRYNSNGTLDSSFDKDGMVFCYGMMFNAVAIQSDGKIVAAGYSSPNTAYFAIARYNSNGTPDNSFDGDGKLTTAIGAGSGVITAIAIQNDGKIIVAGYSNSDFALARYNTDGTLDNSFDGDGKLTTDLGSTIEMATSLALQNDGKIVVGGYSSASIYSSANVNNFALVRYNTDGTLDNSFDGDGKLVTAVGTSYSEIASIAIQSDGKILAAGYGSVSASSDFALARYNVDGSPDNSFDTDGIVLTHINSSSYDRAKSIVIQNDGKIIVAGYSSIGSNSDFALVRYNTDGTLDTSFDADGRVTTNMNSAHSELTGMVVQNDGKIVAAGSARGNTNRDNFALARYNMDGSLDNSFDGDGKMLTNIGSSHDLSNAIAVQSDGKIILAGLSNPVDPDGAAASKNESSLVRYLPDGTLDNSFDGDGKVVTAMSPESDYITCIALQSDGKIVAAGTAKNYNYDFAIARYNTDGSLDNSFDGDGKVFTPITTSPIGGFLNCMAIQPDGKIVVAGRSLLPYEIVIARYNTNGSLDNSFDMDGIRTLNIGGGGVNAIAIQSDGKIVVAGYTYNASNADIALARFNTDGSLDNSFDNDGIVTTAIGSGDDVANVMAIQSNGKIVVAGYTDDGGGSKDFAIVRYNTDGSLDNSFEGDGKLTTDLGTYYDEVYSIAIQTNGKLIVLGSGNTLVRYNSDGTLDNSFDGDGKFTVDFGTGSSASVSHMALYANRIYLSGNIETEGAYDFNLVAVLNDVFLSALPLQLLDFSGKRVNEDALVSWKTENEINTSGFIVERSTDGRNYIAVGSVTAANSAGFHYYDFTDHNVISLDAPVLYYRLKQKDMDGGFTYSRIVALPVDKNKNIVLFYPNPVINEANVAMTVNRQERLAVRIIDNKGAIIKQQQWDVSAGSTSLSIDVKNLAAGLYYLEIKGETVDYKKQFVK